MSTVFATGKVATGSQFIGRHTEVAKVVKLFYDDKKNIAMVGLPRIGKTSIMEKAYEQINKQIKDKSEKSIILKINLASELSFETVWQSIIVHLYEEAQQINVIDSTLEEIYKSFTSSGDTPSYSVLKLRAGKFLSRLKKLDVNIFLMIDEFDAAVDKFQKKRYYYEFFRDIGSRSDYSVSFLLVSRQLIKRIEANAYGQSTLFGIFDDIIIRAFNNEDMEVYYEKLRENNLILNDDDKEELNEFAGCNPYLLAILGDRLIDTTATGETLSVQQIYQKEQKNFFDYFEALMHQMNRDGNLSQIQEIVIGPLYKITKTDIDNFDNMGYLSYSKIKNSRNEQENVRIVVSDTFVSYLKLHLEKPVWQELETAYKLIGQLLKEQLPKIYKKPVLSLTPVEFNQMLEDEHSILCTDFIRKSISSTRKRCACDLTYVEIASFISMAEEMRKYWDVVDIGFRYKFDNKPYSPYWEDCFKRLNDSRNDCAHFHENFLSERDIQDTNNYCQRIKELLTQTKK